MKTPNTSEFSGNFAGSSVGSFSSSLSIASKWGKSWLFGPGSGKAGHAPALALDEMRDDEAGTQGYIRYGRESKMEIPVSTFQELSSGGLHV